MWNINIGDTIVCKDGTIYTACNMADVPYGGLDNPYLRNYAFVGILVQYGITSWNGWYKDGSATRTGKDDLDIEQVIPKEQPMQETKQPRKHAELIKAWADGATLQQQMEGSDLWFDCEYHVHFYDNLEYRIKPEVKPDVVTMHYATSHTVFKDLEDERFPDNLKLTFDGETGKLKSAEVIETE